METSTMDLYSPTSAGATAPTAHQYDGRKLSRLRNLSAEKRALLAFDLQHGARLYNLTRAQAAAVAKVAPSYIGTVATASDEERQRLAYGWTSLSAIHNRHRRPATDADIERIVKKIGPDRVMRALDRITAPELAAAE
ncbi:hypothetical protein ACVWXQ_008941 [Bradyrhizobium sp. S3.14.4]